MRLFDLIAAAAVLIALTVAGPAGASFQVPDVCEKGSASGGDIKRLSATYDPLRDDRGQV